MNEKLGLCCCRAKCSKEAKLKSFALDEKEWLTLFGNAMIDAQPQEIKDKIATRKETLKKLPGSKRQKHFRDETSCDNTCTGIAQKIKKTLLSNLNSFKLQARQTIAQLTSIPAIKKGKALRKITRNDLFIALSQTRQTITTLQSELMQAHKTIAELTSVPVINLITNEEEIMARPSSSSSSSSSSSTSSSSSIPPSTSSTKKRKRQSIEQITETIQKNVRVKVEKVTEKLQEDLLEAQDTNGYLIQSENNKMTEIERLKKEIQTMQRKIEESENTIKLMCAK